MTRETGSVPHGRAMATLEELAKDPPAFIKKHLHLLTPDRETPARRPPMDTSPHAAGMDPFEKILSEMGALHRRKSSDYSPGEDHYKNLRQCADFGISAFEEVLVRISDKWERIKRLQNKHVQAAHEIGDGCPAVLDETLRDTLIDLCVHSVIALVLFDEEGRAGRDAVMDHPAPVTGDVSGMPGSRARTASRRAPLSMGDLPVSGALVFDDGSDLQRIRRARPGRRVDIHETVGGFVSYIGGHDELTSQGDERLNVSSFETRDEAVDYIRDALEMVDHDACMKHATCCSCLDYDLCGAEGNGDGLQSCRECGDYGCGRHPKTSKMSHPDEEKGWRARLDGIRARVGNTARIETTTCLDGGGLLSLRVATDKGVAGKAFASSHVGLDWLEDTLGLRTRRAGLDDQEHVGGAV